jgi:hypothetical protein
MASRPCKQKQAQEIKIWPQLAIAAWQINAGGAYKVWRLAHNFDRAGSGKITRPEFYKYLNKLGVPARTRRRWINGEGGAVELGLLSEAIDNNSSEVVYYLAGLARGAAALDCQAIGAPVIMGLPAFVDRGWRSMVWAAYHATVSGPASQKTKENLTGVSPRTQRNYLKNAPIEKKKNYAKRDLKADPAYLAGLKENTGQVVFITDHGDGRQRLPDCIAVPETVAKKAPKGRTRKAQKRLTTLSMVVRGKSEKFVRLFHENAKGLLTAEKRTAAIPGGLEPTELFLKANRNGQRTLYEPVPLVAPTL